MWFLMRLLEASETSLMILFWPFATAFTGTGLIVNIENLLPRFSFLICSRATFLNFFFSILEWAPIKYYNGE